FSGTNGEQVENLKDNQEEEQELFLFNQTNGGLERCGIWNWQFVLAKKHPGEGSVFICMAFPKTYRDYEEGRIVVSAPISGVTMPTQTTLDATPTSATNVRAPAPVDHKCVPASSGSARHW
ncbi:hypothetical protein BpHYR1_032343, partial [Brachionus plicatilis]